MGEDPLAGLPTSSNATPQLPPAQGDLASARPAAEAKRRKIFVLDTNVILHDSSCIETFEEHDVVIPITVLEELDQFKKGGNTVNFHAREFVRALDALDAICLFNGGVALGPGRGRVQVKVDQPLREELTANFRTSIPDHHILNIACIERKQHPARSVVLVSKDVNLRMKARAVGLQAEDYTTDHVEDISSLYRGHRTLEGLCPSVLDGFYASPEGIAASELGLDPSLTPNEYMILRNGTQSGLARFDARSGRVVRVAPLNAYGISSRNAEQSFALNALMDDSIRLVSLTGKAGTGKTLLALAAALERRRSFHQVLMARPIVPLSNRDSGFLPGDIQSKLHPYMQPLYDNLGVIRGQFAESDPKFRRLQEMQESEKLIISPLSYIRGRSIVRVFFIVDEAQNLTPHEVKTIITRAGEGTKVVFTGDIFQIDHPYLDSHSNGLSYMIEKMQGQSIYAHVNLEKGERSELAELASNLL